MKSLYEKKDSRLTSRRILAINTDLESKWKQNFNFCNWFKISDLFFQLNWSLFNDLKLICE
jgi:hypothetical protein